METYFCSDHHFGHTNVLSYETDARPFENIQEMHEVIIERHNKVVRPNDLVYFLGDFCFGKQNIEIAARLNGRKKLILGNHDTYETSDYLKFFEKAYGVLIWKGCLLTHVPVHPDQLNYRVKLNVHGHLHSRNVLDGDNADNRYFNVSIEQNNLTPFHEDEILYRLKEIN